VHCAFSWAICPAHPRRPGQRAIGGAGGDLACAVRAPGAVRLLIGDVMGHGPRAEATATAIAREFRLRAAQPEPLRVIAERLHDFVARRPAHPSTWGEEFVTAQFVEVPLAAKAPAEIVCCGHPPPLLLRGVGGASSICVPLDELAKKSLHGLPLGLLGLDDRPVEPCQLPVLPGDALLFYTDGVSEACDAGGRLYPLAERTAALAVRQPADAAETLADRILSDVLKHTDQGVLRDDATLLYLQFTRAAAAVEPSVRLEL
jgi:serine phosphatase RsbU (regulator of sigma subunit)